jgi:hypothetical protein
LASIDRAEERNWTLEEIVGLIGLGLKSSHCPRIYGQNNLQPMAASCAADLLEHFHDRRVVWSFEIQEQTALARGFCELGHRLL